MDVDYNKGPWKAHGEAAKRFRIILGERQQAVMPFLL